MRFLLLATLLCDSPVCESSVSLGLKFLARHQNEDGSWDRPPASCRCTFGPPAVAPNGIPSDAKVKEAVDRLVAAFDDEDIRIRTQAQEDLIRLGAPAAPFLWKRSREGNLEIRGRCRDTLERLWNRDLDTRVRWADVSIKPECATGIRTTSFVLLCFLGAGYSHLSRDEYADPAFPERKLKFGETVKQGFTWLLKQQDAQGSFAPKDPVAHAMATLAMAEAFGMTETELLKDPAQRSVNILLTLTSSDPRFNSWKGIALYSAKLSELSHSREPLARQIDILNRESSTFARATAILLSSLENNTADEDLLEWFRGLDPDSLRSDELCIATMAARAVWLPERPEWKQWAEQVKARYVPAQILERRCGYGGWARSGGFDVAILASCSSIDTLLRYYRYANPFAQRPEVRH